MLFSDTLFVKVSDLEWRTLLVGALVTEPSGEDGGADGGGTGAESKPENLTWLSVKAWDQLLAYEATLGDAFAGLPYAIESMPHSWKVHSSTRRRLNAEFDLAQPLYRTRTFFILLPNSAVSELLSIV